MGCAILYTIMRNVFMPIEPTETVIVCDICHKPIPYGEAMIMTYKTDDGGVGINAYHKECTGFDYNK